MKMWSGYYKKFDNEIGYHKFIEILTRKLMWFSGTNIQCRFRWFRDRYKSNFIIGFGNDGGYYRINNVFSNRYKFTKKELECLKTNRNCKEK